MGAHLNSILLDTHVLLWWLGERDRLSPVAKEIIEDSDTKAYVSSASTWEIVIKNRLGKLQAGPILSKFERMLEEEGFTELKFTVAHALQVGAIKTANKDPFDQLLAAQATVENLPIVSADKFFDRVEVRRIW